MHSQNETKLLKYIRAWFKVPDDILITGSTLLAGLCKDNHGIGLLPDAVEDKFKIPIDDDTMYRLVRAKAKIKDYLQLLKTERNAV